MDIDAMDIEDKLAEVELELINMTGNEDNYLVVFVRDAIKYIQVLEKMVRPNRSCEDIVRLGEELKK